MVRLFITTGLLLTLTSPICAASRQLSCYLDGGIVSREVAVAKGYAELSLPAGMVPGSLRVKPENGSVIIRVESLPARVDPRTEKALALLDERGELLGDRLRALQTREEIFTAAAKSQSAKAPRKSKANPEPVTAIRQGTDLALTRLEEVYRLRRATEKELKGLEEKRRDLSRRANVGGSVARIRVQGRCDVVTVAYATRDAAWKPSYDLRSDGPDTAVLTLRALLPETETGTFVTVTPTPLASPTLPSDPLPVAGDYAAVANYTLPVVATATTSPLGSLSVALTNSTVLTLPSGDAACFWKGEFRGRVHLPAIPPGERVELLCGSPPDTLAPATGR